MKKILHTFLIITCICLSGSICGMKRLNPNTNDTQSDHIQESFFFPDEVIVALAAHSAPKEKNVLMQISQFFYQVLKNGRYQIICANPWNVYKKDLEKALFNAVYSEKAYPGGIHSDLYDLVEKLLKTKLIYFKYSHYCVIRNILNKTPFHYAVEKNNEAMQKLFIAHGALYDEDIPNVDPLHEAVCQGNLEQVKFLIESGTDPNLIFTNDGCYRYSFTPLHIAVHENHPEIVRYLLSMNANQHIFEDNKSLLHIAATRNAITIAKLLLDHGAQVNLQTEGYNNTPLHVIADTNNVEMANLLFEYGANVNLHNFMGDTPLDIAAQEDNIKMVRCLLCATNLNISKHQPLCFIVEQGLSETMKCLLCVDNIQVDGYSIGYKKTALYYALAKDQPFYQSIKEFPSDERDKKIIELVKALLDAGATLPCNYSPLHIAIENDHSFEVIQFLLDKGIDVNKQAGYLNKTALYLAAELDNSEHVELLLAHGADPNIQNKYGKAASTIAQEKKHVKVFLLIARHTLFSQR